MDYKDDIDALTKKLQSMIYTVNSLHEKVDSLSKMVREANVRSDDAISPEKVERMIAASLANYDESRLENSVTPSDAERMIADAVKSMPTIADVISAITVEDINKLYRAK